jgi:arylsulfatase A-like enzyme
VTDTNVLFVVADSLRAANTSLLGYRRETTPFLSEFAAESTVYTQARAPSNWTVPSHVSMFTGTDAAAHGFEITERLTEGHTIWEELAAAGYGTTPTTPAGNWATGQTGSTTPTSCWSGRTTARGGPPAST